MKNSTGIAGVSLGTGAEDASGDFATKPLKRLTLLAIRFLTWAGEIPAVPVLTLVLTTFVVANAQTRVSRLRPDYERALSARPENLNGPGRKDGYVPARQTLMLEQRAVSQQENRSRHAVSATRLSSLDLDLAATTAIVPGTPLNRVLHTSKLSLTSSDGTNEQFVDRNNDLVADEQTTFDSAAGSYDIAVGRSGARYEVYSATLNSEHVGVIVVALDTNGDYRADTSSTYNLESDFELPSAVSVVTGVSRSGREFVVVCSSGYYNSSNPDDPNNEPSPGVILLVRDPNIGGFDTTSSRELVQVGDNRLYNANALALLPNNDLLVADFHSNELRLVRDTNGDGMPDTLDSTPYYSFRFSNDAPLDIAVNPRGIVYSHSAGNDVVMLAIYDDNGDRRGDRDEEVVTGLSIDNNLFLHGLTVGPVGRVFVIEDAEGTLDGSGGNGGEPRIDVFPDNNSDGFLADGFIFARAGNSGGLALSGLSFGIPQLNPIEDTKFFITQQYLDFLGRLPDSVGLANWLATLNACPNGGYGENDNPNCDRVHVSAGFFLSQEFRIRGYWAYRFYEVAFDRRPTYAEFVPDMLQVGGSQSPESEILSKAVYTNAFVQRTEFRNRYDNRSNSFYVDTLEQNAEVTVPNKAALIAALDRGDKTRAQVLREIIESQAVDDRFFIRAFVAMQYFGYLKRNPDTIGYNNWVTTLTNDPSNYRHMIFGFIYSSEYRSRFGPP